jgi:hypothetical protein
MVSTPGPEMLETLFLPQLEKDNDLTGLIALYKQDVIHKDMPRSYERLMSMVKCELAERRRKQVRDAKAGKGGDVSNVVEGALCRSMLKTGQCNRGDSCPYNHKDALKEYKGGKGKGAGKDKSQRGRSQDRTKGAGRDTSPNEKGKGQRTGSPAVRGTSPSGKKEVGVCFDWV